MEGSGLWVIQKRMNYFSGNYLNHTKSFTATEKGSSLGILIARGCREAVPGGGRSSDLGPGVTPVQGNRCSLEEGKGHAKGGRVVR